MSVLLHELLLNAAHRRPEQDSVLHQDDGIDYAELAQMVQSVSRGLIDVGLSRQERVAVHLTKRFETVAAMFASTLAGGVFVPVNPLLKPEQIVHILRDCNVRVLVTSAESLARLRPVLEACEDLRVVVTLGADDEGARDAGSGYAVVTWSDLLDAGGAEQAANVIDADMAAIFYTSGSTGKPKGVVLSHLNMVTGAESVSRYLENVPADRLLAVLPFSFDYGFSQLSTAFSVGATVALMDYLFPQDVIGAVAKYGITGLAGVPPLWIQLAKRAWPDSVRDHLRYITNSGGAMPDTTLGQLRENLPTTRVFLMYGLTEAFRSTYLPPEEIDRRPGSIGKAIPNAEVMVVRPDGTRCDVDEPGELVHRGSLVALGYWDDPEKTARRFRPVPGQDNGIVLPQTAVWSGDTVRQDADGYLYFVGRSDDMIKTSGYRVSPAEVEEVLYSCDVVGEAIATGVPHPELGQAVVVVAVAADGREPDDAAVTATCREHLPVFMHPARIIWQQSLPRNPNGKIDRTQVRNEIINIFQ